MITQQNAQDLITAARFQRATLVNANRVLQTVGAYPVGENKVDRLKNNIKALTYCVYSLNDLTSATFLSVYDCLSKIVGLGTNPTIDPNYQNPHYTINVTAIAGGAVTYTYHETDLIDAGGGNYYLPFNFDITKFVPIELVTNGVGIPIQPDYNFTPMRLFGFANNATQTILLTIIGSTSGTTPITYPFIFSSQFTSQFG